MAAVKIFLSSVYVSEFVFLFYLAALKSCWCFTNWL